MYYHDFTGSLRLAQWAAKAKAAATKPGRIRHLGKGRLPAREIEFDSTTLHFFSSYTGGRTTGVKLPNAKLVDFKFFAVGPAARKIIAFDQPSEEARRVIDPSFKTQSMPQTTLASDRAAWFLRELSLSQLTGRDRSRSLRESR